MFIYVSSLQCLMKITDESGHCTISFTAKRFSHKQFHRKVINVTITRTTSVADAAFTETTCLESINIFFIFFVYAEQWQLKGQTNQSLMLHSKVLAPVRSNPSMKIPSIFGPFSNHRPSVINPKRDEKNPEICSHETCGLRNFRFETLILLLS